MKWIGAFIIVFAAYWGGNIMAKEAGKTAMALTSLLALLGYMRRRITAHRTPLYQVFASFNDEFLEKTGVLPKLREHKSISPKSWEEAIDLLPLGKQIRQEIALLGGQLGVLPLNEQEKAIDACCVALSEELEKERASLAPRQKTIKTIFLLSGALVAILLL